MPKFNEFIKGFEEPEAEAQPQPEVKPEVKEQPKPIKPEAKGPGDYRVTKTRYKKVGDNWEEESKDYSIRDEKFAKNVLRNVAQPYEQSHRLYKQGKGPHKYDTYETISPEGDVKNQWRIEFPSHFDKEEQPQPKPAPKPGSFSKMIEGFDKKEARPLQAEQYHKPEDRGFEPKPVKKASVEENVKGYFQDPSFRKTERGLNNYANKKGEEYWVGTPEEAHEAAKQEVKDLISNAGIESFSPEFRDWIYENAVSEQGMKQLREDYAEMFRDMGQPEDAEWILKTDDNNLRAFIINSFPDTWQEEYQRSDALDYDKIAEEALEWDDPAHFLSYYDGKEVDLGNGLVAYRQN